jgi:hypothetical protein
MGLIGVKLSSVSALFAGFAIAKLFPEVLSVNVWWFILICIGLVVHLDLHRAGRPSPDGFLPARRAR